MGHGDAVEHALHCLALLGKRTSVWPVVDEGLAADLARLLFFGSEASAELLTALLADRARAVQLGDLRPLRRAIQQPNKTQNNAKDKNTMAVVMRSLDAIGSCGHCGKTSRIAREAPVCTPVLTHPTLAA